MTETLPPLAQSDSKARFMQRLGLSNLNPNGNAIYKEMKAEATRQRTLMLGSREALLPHIRDDPSVQPPFSSSQVGEYAMAAAVNRTYEDASPLTKPFYDKGQLLGGFDQETGAPVYDNWIIRWLLWHVFRYRDSRNRHASSSSIPIIAAILPVQTGETALAFDATDSTQSPISVSSNGGSASQVVLSSQPTLEIDVALASVGAMQHKRALPYDPVRDS